MDRAAEIIKSHLIDPFKEKEYSYIGMEFEYPVICMGETVSLREIGSAFLRELIYRHGFQEEIRGSDGYYVRVSRDGDSASFDYSYSLFEISLGKQENILALRDRMLPILKMAQEYYRGYGCVLTGMGTRPVKNSNVEYTCDPFYTMIREFVAKYAEEKKPWAFFPNMCSVQTHIDVPYVDLLGCYNLFNRLDFVRGLLFANSLGSGAEKETVYCVRDLMWEGCGIPNTGLYDKSFDSLDELAEAISGEYIFVRMEGDKLVGMEPVKLSAYFEDESKPEEHIRFFRSFKRIVLNSYHVLEIRGDCTQPVRDSFVTAAFHLGTAYNYKKAAAVLEQFLSEHNITASNSELRAMAIRGQEIAGEEEMKGLLNRLVDIAKEALVSRGYGEETLLEPLRTRIDKFTNPAKEHKKALDAEQNVEELLRQYAEV